MKTISIRKRSVSRCAVALVVSLALALTAIPATANIFHGGNADAAYAYGATRPKAKPAPKPVAKPAPKPVAKPKPASVTVKFDAGKGKVAAKSKKVTAGKKYGALPKATRAGYRFTGWFTKKSGGKKITAGAKVTAGTKTLYAHWKKKGGAKSKKQRRGGKTRVVRHYGERLEDAA